MMDSRVLQALYKAWWGVSARKGKKVEVTVKRHRQMLSGGGTVRRREEIVQKGPSTGAQRKDFDKRRFLGHDTIWFRFSSCRNREQAPESWPCCHRCKRIDDLCQCQGVFEFAPRIHFLFLLIHRLARAVLNKKRFCSRLRRWCLNIRMGPGIIYGHHRTKQR